MKQITTETEYISSLTAVDKDGKEITRFNAQPYLTANHAWMIDNAKMKEQIEEAEQEIKDFADGKKLTPEEEIAASFGFKK